MVYGICIAVTFRLYYLYHKVGKGNTDTAKCSKINTKKAMIIEGIRTQKLKFQKQNKRVRLDTCP